MLPMSSWLLLRVPRASGAKEMSGVLGAGDFIATSRGADIPSVCDALLAKAGEAGRDVAAVTLVFRLDGRHMIAGDVLDEANRRGWSFSRHVPRGAEPYLLDLEGPDAAPGVADVTPIFEAVSAQVRAAIG